MRCVLLTPVILPNHTDDHTYCLPTDERTLPPALRKAGYQTARVGKWHLGHTDQKYWPLNRGFDHFNGNLIGEVKYFEKSDEHRCAATIKDPTRRTDAAMITSLDDQVGRIVAALDRRSLSENTPIIFSFDGNTSSA